MDSFDVIDRFIGVTPEEQMNIIDEITNNPDEYGNDLPQILIDVIPFLDREVAESKIEDIYETIGLMPDLSKEDYEEYLKKFFVSAYEYLDEDFKDEADLLFDKVFEKINLKSKPNMGIYKSYFEKVLQNDEFALVNSSFVNHMYQAVQAGVVENYGFDFEDGFDLDDICAENIKPKDAPDMSRFDTVVDNLQAMDEETFDAFVQDLQILKTNGEPLPEKYCDYIIAEKLNPNSVLNRYFSEKYMKIFDRAFEDKTSHVLSTNGVEKKYLINVTNVSRAELGGEANEYGRVIFNRDYVHKLSRDNTSCINTLFHECRHAKQFEKYKESDMNTKVYVMLKDSILREKLMEQDYDYYRENYDVFYPEIDARISGEKERSKYLKQLGMTEAEILASDVDEDKTYAEKQRSEIEKYSTKRKYKGVEVDVNDLFAEQIKRFPGIIKQYPVLGFEFNEDGTRKTREEMYRNYVEAYNEVLENKDAAKTNGFKIMSVIIRDVFKEKPSKVLFGDVENPDFNLDLDFYLDSDIDLDFENDPLSELILGDGCGGLMSKIHDSVSPKDIQEGRFMLGEMGREDGTNVLLDDRQSEELE